MPKFSEGPDGGILGHKNYKEGGEEFDKWAKGQIAENQRLEEERIKKEEKEKEERENTEKNKKEENDKNTK